MTSTHFSTAGSEMLRVLLLCIAALLCMSAVAIPAMAADENPAVLTDAEMMDLNVPFIANSGQQPAEVKYYADTFYGRAFVTGTDITHAVEAKTDEGVKGVALKEQFMTADGLAIAFAPVGEDPAETKVSYFIGSDQSSWQTGLPTYNFVSLGEVYPGITVKVKAHGANVEKLFCVSPGTSPDDIRVKVQGADSLRIADDGGLVIATGDGEVSLTAPDAFQDGQAVAVAYRVNGDGTYGFAVGEYDRAKTLVIDPSLEYSTYLGGSGIDVGRAIVVDDAGSAYIAGQTSSSDFPTTAGSYQSGIVKAYDVYVSKLNPAGTGLIYSTYLGGSGTQDYAYGLAVDDAGSAYISGSTSSSNFPTTTGAYQTTIGGGGDCFMSKFSSDGTSLLYSTYLGGTLAEGTYGFAMDSSGNAYLSGNTASTDFPTTTGAYQTATAGSAEAFVAKLNPAGGGTSDLVYSTYLGGAGNEQIYNLVLDDPGNIYVTGTTTSVDLPVTVGAYQTANAGGTEAFVAKFNPAGGGTSDLVYSTYLGGTDADYGYGILKDNSDNIYVTGYSASTDFPTTTGAYQTANAGSSDIFISKFNPAGTGLLYSTYLGGSGAETTSAGGKCGSLDNLGNVYITGLTASTDFPTTTGAYQTTNAGGTDVFVSQLSPSGSSLVYSTYIGGSNSESDTHITLDVNGDVYISGTSTGSTDFPTTPGAFQTTYGGGSRDAFVAKFSFASASAPVADFSADATSGIAPLTVTFTDLSTNTPTSWSWDFGDGDSTNATEQDPVHTYAAAGTYTVTLTATNAAGSDDETRTDYIAVTAPTPPVAGFAADVVSGTAPLDVQFTDQSYNATTWAWDFENDGIIDNTTANPVWTYTAAGTYNVNLTVTGPGGSDSEVKTDYITVAAGARTWYVDASGAGDFTTIQPAIDAASPGDTIIIRAGTYSSIGEIYITNGQSDLTIMGENTDSVILQAGNGFSIRDDAPRTHVQNITFDDTVLIVGSTISTGDLNNVIEHNVFLNPTAMDGGLMVTGSSNTFRDNEFISATGAYTAASIMGSSNLIENNTFRDGAAAGLTLYGDNNTVTRNTVINNAYAGIEFYSDGYYNENNRIYLNTISGNGVSATTTGTTPPTTTYWVSPEAVTYTYNGNTYSGILGNFWDTDYTGTDVDGNGIGDTAYTVPESLGSDTAPLMGAWDGSGITGPGVEAPVADFSGTPTSGTEPLTVEFTDASTNAPTSWVWDFGDGDSTNATEQDPVHTYELAGTYTVNLTATNAGGSDSEEKSGYITVSEGARPDFLITLVNTNPSYYATGQVFARETNIVRATVKNNGTAASPEAVLRITADDGFTGTATIPAIAAAGQVYVLVEDTTIRPLQNVTVTYSATADPDNLIAEAFEGNNAKDSTEKTVKYNGYKGARYWEGKSDVTTYNTYDLRGNLIHSFGDGAYRSGSFGSGWYSYNTTWTATDLPIPDGATVREARLYVPYTWDYEQRAPDNITIAFNDVTVPYQHWYHDVSNFGAYSTHTYGLMTYDVTSLFAANGDNIATITRPGFTDTISPYGFTLAVVYEDQNATRKQIFMNEEFDLLGASLAGYSTTEAEATAYIPFTGLTIDPANVTAANLVTFVPSGYGPEGTLLFNGNVIQTQVWDHGPSSGPQVAVDTRDIKAYITPTGNEAGIRGEDAGSPCLAASQQFLIVEYEDEAIVPVAAFSGTPTSGTVPLTITFTDLSTNTPTSWSWDFGDGDTTNATEQNPVHTYVAAGNYSVTLTATNSAGSDSETVTDYITISSTGIVTLPGQTDPPTDPDSDGLYEDLNGNGRMDYNDVYLYYTNMDWIAENEPLAAFDFNGNGRIDYNDVYVLFQEMV